MYYFKGSSVLQPPPPLLLRAAVHTAATEISQMMDRKATRILEASKNHMFKSCHLHMCRILGGFLDHKTFVTVADLTFLVVL